MEDINPVERRYEATKDPIDWDYVNRVLPPTVVPQPLKKDTYPSGRNIFNLYISSTYQIYCFLGWKPQEENLADRPYFISRTKNHMFPCYLKISNLKTRKTTVLRNIKGDIWLLEKEIKEFLTPQFFQPIRSQVNEFAGYIRINGDYVNAVKYFLEQKGY